MNKETLSKLLYCFEDGEEVFEIDCKTLTKKKHKFRGKMPRYFSSVQISNHELLITGGHILLNKTDLSTARIFDTNLGKFKAVAQMPVPNREHHLLHFDANTVILTGGISESAHYSCFKYDILRYKWSELPALNQARCAHIAYAFAESVVYVAYGWN